MSNIGDILAKKNLPNEPTDFGVIRQFIRDNFDSEVKLQVRDQGIVISVPGSALAASLRFRLPELENLLENNYKLVIVTH